MSTLSKSSQIQDPQILQRPHFYTLHLHLLQALVSGAIALPDMQPVGMVHKSRPLQETPL